MGNTDVSGKNSSSRPPTVDDLKLICRRFNELGVKYILVGGIAMNVHGRPRMTHDLIAIITSFSARIYGAGSQKFKKIAEILKDETAQNCSS
ncbi:MAG: hypothetical protein JRI31_08910 [Deltaproteobacteria bacterium]|nr:hypothetical protein [Deltaproteobacteria bacterium]